MVSTNSVRSCDSETSGESLRDRFDDTGMAHQDAARVEERVFQARGEEGLENREEVHVVSSDDEEEEIGGDRRREDPEFDQDEGLPGIWGGWNKSIRDPVMEAPERPEENESFGEDAKGISSSITMETLEDIRVGWCIPDAYSLIAPGPGDRAYTSKGPKTICVYAHDLLCGFNFPPHPFIEKVLSWYQVPLCMLSPNSLRGIVAFIHACKEFDYESDMEAFRRYFYIGRMRYKGEMKVISFRPKLSFMTGIPDSMGRWNDKFFYVHHEEGWRFPTEWRSVTLAGWKNKSFEPSKEDTRRAEFFKRIEGDGTAERPGLIAKERRLRNSLVMREANLLSLGVRSAPLGNYRSSIFGFRTCSYS